MIKEKLKWVESQLRADKTLADSNEKLYFKYLKAIGYDVTKSVTSFLKDMDSGRVCYLDSIGRASRKVQENYPELRGEKYGKRKVREQQVKQEIRGL